MASSLPLPVEDAAKLRALRKDYVLQPRGPPDPTTGVAKGKHWPHFAGGEYFD